MRFVIASILAAALVACGSSHSGSSNDAPPGAGDGSGGGSDSGGRVAQVTVQSGTGAGTFTLNVQPATHDLVIAHAVPLGGGAGDFAIDAAAVARGVVVSGATIAPPVDFSTADGKTVPVTVLTS